MAAFCVQCGSPVAPGTKFCSKCGAAVAGTPVAAAPTPQVSAPPPPITPAAAPGPAPSQGGNTAVKVILIIVSVIVFFMLLVAGSCFYVAYRFKKKAHEITQEMGGNAPAYTGSREPCSFLSASEAGRILGQPVEKAESSGSTCQYTYGRGGDHRFAVDYTWQGGNMAMGLTRGAMKMVAGMQTYQSVDGLGDEAYIAPGGSGLMMRKGDVLVNIDLRVSGVSVGAAEKMAAAIAARL